MHRLRTSCWLPAALVAVLALTAAPLSAADFPLKDGDVWVMAGDSITAQHLHSNYFEAFCYARYPKMKFALRNSGVGGDTIPKVLARFDWDVAAWKPTVVSVELGMNDQGGFPVPEYIANMGKLSDKIRSVQARPVFFTASPINNGSTLANIGGNKKLADYAVALKEFAAKEKAPFADQFHQLVDVWGKNKPRENLINALPSLKSVAADDHLAGVEHLRAFLAAQEKSTEKFVSMKGDAVHPGEPGQLTMAAALLKELGADPFVSSATIEATGKLVDAKGCVVDEVKAEAGKLTFDRLDERLPFPIPDEARPVLPLYPTILELSQYTLKVTGLTGEHYTLKVNGIALATVTGKELAEGVNLSAYGPGPIAGQGKEILAAVSGKEGLVGQWRGQSKAATAADATAEAKFKFAELTKKVEEADGKIREAAKPRKLHFEVVPEKP
jgi:lysophospholipase L1-like esterase